MYVCVCVYTWKEREREGEGLEGGGTLRVRGSEIS